MDLEELLGRSNARFEATMKSILERYNQPFEDDVVISMENLTYYTPEGPEQWEKVTAKKIKKWRKEIFKANPLRTGRGILCLSLFMWVATAYVLAVTLTAWREVSDQCGRGRSHRSNAGKVYKEEKKESEPQTSEFENGCSTVHQECPENFPVDTSCTDEESDADTDSARRKCEDVHFQNLYVVDGQSQEKVKVDVIVQDDCRKIPKWIMKAPCQRSSESLHLASPVQELIGNQAAYGKKLELSNEWSSSRPLQLQFSGVPISPNAITVPSHRPSPELNKTYSDSILEEYQNGGGEFWSNITIADLYPAMVELLKRLMMKQAQRNQLEYSFGHLRHKRWHSRRPNLNITVDKIRGFRPLKLKRALPSICSSTSENIWNQTLGNKNRDRCDDKCCINDLCDLVPYSYIDTNESKTDSSLEHHLVSGESPKVFKQTVFPNAVSGMGETFLVEDELQTPVSLKNSKYKDSEKQTYKCSSECCFIVSTASSGSTALHLVEESKTPKNYFPCGDTSVLCSPTSSSYGNSNTLTPVTSSCLARASNTLFINPEKKISGRQLSFQNKVSFSSLSIKQGPSRMSQKNDPFEELYYKLCSKEIPKPLTLTRPLSNSQNLEEKGTLVKSSDTLYDREFDRIYEELCCEADPKLLGFQRALNVRKFEGMQMSETVKALVNSPVQNTYAVLRPKRLGNFQNDHLCSPLKRLKNISECHSPSTKCQQISQRKNVNLWTDGMDFLSMYNHSNPSLFDHHNRWSQDSGFHAASESRIADDHSDWPKDSKELTVVPKMYRSYHQRVSRKLSYTDGK